MSRAMPFWSRTGTTSTTPAVIALPDGWNELKIEVDAQSLAQVGAAYAAPAVSATNGIITISTPGSPTSGDFRLRFYPGQDGQFDTAAIAYNASAATIKTEMTTTAKFASGDITAAGGALPTDVTLTLTGVYAGMVVPMVGIENFDAGNVIARVTTVPDGNGGYAYLPADTQEIWSNDRNSAHLGRYLYVATVASTGNYFVTAYR